METIGVKLAWLVVKDLNAAIDFYVGTMGLSLRSKAEEYGWAELSGPEGASIGLAEAGKETSVKPGENAVITLSVKDIEKAKKLFVEKGAKIEGDIIEIPGHVKLLTFFDKDGNRMQLVQELH